jgi:hypothetical protein
VIAARRSALHHPTPVMSPRRRASALHGRNGSSTSRTHRERAVHGAVTLTPTVVAPRWISALRLHMGVGQAVEAKPSQLRWDGAR